MDEVETIIVETVGEQLRAAREAKGMTLEEIASSTRIPTRHLESLEASDWSALPAPTYSIGFAKSFAGAVGLDRNEIGEQLRTEMGGSRPATHVQPELFEPSDPKRSMPLGLVLGALAAIIILAIGLNWLNNRSLDDDSPVAASEAAPVAATPAPVAAPVSAGPVVVTANDAVWVDIRDGATILKQGELSAGQSFEVPAGAVSPTITTAKPEALRISIGTADAPSIGPAGRKVTASLKPADLRKGPQAAAADIAPTGTTSVARTSTRRAAPTAPPAAATETPSTNTAG